MKTLLRWIGRAILFLVVIIGVLYLFGPYERVDTKASFDATKLEAGIDVYLKSAESAFDDIRPGQQKQVIWAGQPKTRTPLSIVYLHGFSASLGEIRPVPDQVAQALGANLVFTRFKGHGRTGDAMAEATVNDWMQDAAEAMALGRATGERVIIISTSTGGTIAAQLATDPELSKDLAGIVFVSPNFALKNPLAPLLTFPAAEYWLPLLAGKRRSFEPLNDGQATNWTTEYPSAAVFPMAAIVKHVQGLDFAAIQIPALFYYSDRDQVVEPLETDRIRGEWGGPAGLGTPQLSEGDDPFAHVIAGDIMSPGNTDHAVQAILEWTKEL